MKNDEVKILWDFNIETDHLIGHRRPDIVVQEKEKNTLLIDIAVTSDVRVEEEEEKERNLSVSLSWSEEAVAAENNNGSDTGSIGALSTITKKLKLYVEKGGMEVSVGLIQN